MRALVGVMLLALAGCAASLKDYRDGTPAFSLEEYFSGDIVAWVRGPALRLVLNIHRMAL